MAAKSAISLVMPGRAGWMERSSQCCFLLVIDLSFVGMRDLYCIVTFLASLLGFQILCYWGCVGKSVPPLVGVIVIVFSGCVAVNDGVSLQTGMISSWPETIASEFSSLYSMISSFVVRC